MINSHSVAVEGGREGGSKVTGKEVSVGGVTLILNMMSVNVMMWIFSLQHLVNLSFLHKVSSVI
jgi:hypothetical protein